MFHRLKYYLVFGVIGVIAVVLVLNKLLVYGLIVFGVGAMGVALWKVLMGAKDTEIYELKKNLRKPARIFLHLKMKTPNCGAAN